jgi:hypothetical protein
MKQIVLLLLVLMLFVGIQGCEKKTTEEVVAETLSAPLGLRSITGDRQVTLVWYASNYESHFNGYEIHRLDTLYSDTTAPEEIPSGFTRVASIPKSNPCNTIQSVTQVNLQNGKTYSFLIVATNTRGEMSKPSNIVTDIPRPETVELEYDTLSISPNMSGYELSKLDTTDMSDLHRPEYYSDDGEGDFILELLNFPGGVANRLWFAGTNDGGMMDLGYMKDWNDADIAPETGYAPTGYSLYAQPGHVYAIKTGDNHYGKIQVIDLNVDAGWLSLKACYQTKAGEPQYKIRP